MHQKFVQQLPVFGLYNNHCEFSTYTQKFKCLLCTDKPVLNLFFKASLNTNNHETTRIFSLKYIFIYSFEKN